MLSTSSINAALSTVTALQRTDYCLVPKPESAISKLNEHTRFNGLVDMSDADNVDTERLYQNLNFIANGIDPNTMATTEHSVVMDDTVKFLINNLRRYLMHTRTVAAVAIDELIEKVNAAKETWNAPSTDIELRLWEPPAPLATSGLQNLVSRYGEEVPYEVKLQKLINEPANYKVIEELIKTGIDELDNAILEWYGTIDQSMIESMWNTFFYGEVNGYIGKTKVESKDNDVWDYFRNITVGYDCAIFVFLLSRKFNEDKHTDSAVSLELFDKVTTNYLTTSGIALQNQIEKINRDVKNKVLVMDTIPDQKVIIVNADVYNKWVEDETNAADILLAFGLDSIRKRFAFKSIFTVDDITENKAVLANAWISEITNSKFRNSNYQLRSAKNTLYALFAEQLDRIPETENSAESTIDDVRETYNHERKIAILSEWKEALDNDLVFNDLENLDPWITRYVCKIRYPGRPCLEILQGIEIALDNNNNTNRHVPNNLSVDEAAFMAVFIYLTRWFIDQLMLSNEWRAIVGSSVENVSRHAMTAATIANVVEVITQVMSGLGTDAIARTLGGELITPEQIGLMVNSEIMTTYSHINFNPGTRN